MNDGARLAQRPFVVEATTIKARRPSRNGGTGRRSGDTRQDEQLLTNRNCARMPARHQCQVNTRHINEQGSSDKEDCDPETPIPMRAFPVRTMIGVKAFGVRPLIVMCVRATTHWVPCVSSGKNVAGP